MVILAVILAVGLFTEVIAPYGYAEINMADRLQGPSLRHFFGTDEMGRDLFSRIIYGTRSTLMISFGTVAFGTGIGIILGSAAGYFGGRADNIIMRFLDVISAIPGILLAICSAWKWDGSYNRGVGSRWCSWGCAYPQGIND